MEHLITVSNAPVTLHRLTPEKRHTTFCASTLPPARYRFTLRLWRALGGIAGACCASPEPLKEVTPAQHNQVILAALAGPTLASLAEDLLRLRREAHGSAASVVGAQEAPAPSVEGREPRRSRRRAPKAREQTES